MRLFALIGVVLLGAAGIGCFPCYQREHLRLEYAAGQPVFVLPRPLPVTGLYVEDRKGALMWRVEARLQQVVDAVAYGQAPQNFDVLKAPEALMLDTVYVVVVEMGHHPVFALEYLMIDSGGTLLISAPDLETLEVAAGGKPEGSAL